MYKRFRVSGNSPQPNNIDATSAERAALGDAMYHHYYWPDGRGKPLRIIGTIVDGESVMVEVAYENGSSLFTVDDSPYSVNKIGAWDFLPHLFSHLYMARNKWHRHVDGKTAKEVYEEDDWIAADIVRELACKGRLDKNHEITSKLVKAEYLHDLLYNTDFAQRMRRAFPWADVFESVYRLEERGRQFELDFMSGK